MSSNSIRRIITGLFVVVLVALASTTLSGQTTLPAQLSLRTINRDDIAAYKLPASTELTGGLSTIGIGQPFNLEAQLDITIPASEIADVSWNMLSKPTNSKARVEDSPLGYDVPLYEPSDRLVYQIAGRKVLRPDVAGYYLVSVTITTVGHGTFTAQRYLTASTYVGIGACTLCHSNGPAATPWSMANSWQKTLHASIFKNGINGVNGASYGSSCWGCHTVGYDTNPAAVNGGFDDVMKQLGWTPPSTLAPGVFEAMPKALQNVANIQCENCHGPGSTHILSGGNPLLISKQFDSGVCGQCHGAASHHIKTMEWNNSGHAIAPRDASGTGRESCVGCHTSNGFVGKLAGTTPVDTTYNAISCQTCHEPHGETTPSTNAHLVRTLTSVTLADGTAVTSAGNGALCMNCHQSRQNATTYAAKTPGSSHFGPHHGPQADMLVGTNGFTYGKKIPSSAHGDVVADTCVACHMQTVAATDPALGKVGGHTFKLKLAANGTNPAVDLVGTCQTCHGPDLTSIDFPLMDYDGDGVIDGVQTEVQHLLDNLALMLPPVGQAKATLNIDATWNQPQLEAAYNYLFVQGDKSLGIHNTAYAVGLLKASIADLNAQAKK
ncbi:MAG TPA: hypothetical protein VEU96_26635 [Bryobacteraceae bacterium]|nr:hypothetical protein [Bryobacteraceae bacterium]